MTDESDLDAFLSQLRDEIGRDRFDRSLNRVRTRAKRRPGRPPGKPYAEIDALLLRRAYEITLAAHPSIVSTTAAIGMAVDEYRRHSQANAQTRDAVVKRVLARLNDADPPRTVLEWCDSFFVVALRDWKRHSAANDRNNPGRFRFQMIALPPDAA